MSISYNGEVTISSSISELPSGQGFLLTLENTNPEGFIEYYANLEPHKAFIYEQVELNGVNKTVFKRVATPPELKSISQYTSGVINVEYRTNKFTGSFEDVTILYTQEKIVKDALYKLWKDVNTISVNLLTVKSHESIVYPSYRDAEITSLVSRYKEIVYDIDNKTAQKTILTETILPIVATVKSQFEFIKTISKSIVPMVDELMANMAAVEGVRNTARGVANTVAASTNAFSNIQQALSNSNSLIASVTSTLHNLVEGSSDDELTDALKLSLSNINKVKVNVDIGSSHSLPNIITLPNITLGIYNNIESITSSASSVAQYADEVKKIHLQAKSAVSKLISLHADITEQGDALAEEIQVLLNTKKTIEVDLTTLVPSIDLKNPQLQWSVTIDVTIEN